MHEIWFIVNSGGQEIASTAEIPYSTNNIELTSIENGIF